MPESLSDKNSSVAKQWNYSRNAEDHPARILYREKPMSFAWTGRLYAKLYRQVFADLNVRQVSCLEIGCGSGDNLFLLSDLGIIGHALGIDIADAPLGLARQKKINGGYKNIDFFCTAYEHYPTDQQVDLVLAMQFINYMEDLGYFFDKLSKLIKNGGYVILFDGQSPTNGVVTMLKQNNLIRGLFGKKPVVSYLHYWNSDYVVSVASRYGFRLRRVSYYCHFLCGLIVPAMYRLVVAEWRHETTRFLARRAYVLARRVVEYKNNRLEQKRGGKLYFVLLEKCDQKCCSSAPV
ncbi:MAG: methyltransferase domain-containing protein [Magnetococcales bacterium]|nr:methyltransferase domain-containing protein [Magnetococcales bacterium]MBF0322989.1 methyltransferase domain-containing protein [Magnetococcales bacterium]